MKGAFVGCGTSGRTRSCGAIGRIRRLHGCYPNRRDAFLTGRHMCFPHGVARKTQDSISERRSMTSRPCSACSRGRRATTNQHPPFRVTCTTPGRTANKVSVYRGPCKNNRISTFLWELSNLYLPAPSPPKSTPSYKYLPQLLLRGTIPPPSTTHHALQRLRHRSRPTRSHAPSRPPPQWRSCRAQETRVCARQE